MVSLETWKALAGEASDSKVATSSEMTTGVASGISLVIDAAGAFYGHEHGLGSSNWIPADTTCLFHQGT